MVVKFQFSNIHCELCKSVSVQERSTQVLSFRVFMLLNNCSRNTCHKSEGFKIAIPDTLSWTRSV